jgi:hypothetical protein
MRQAAIIWNHTYTNGKGQMRTVNSVSDWMVIYTDHIGGNDYHGCSCRLATFAAWARKDLTLED